ncbi:MAG: hypothetical protein ABF289_11560 [Clostridiales bacterium]
MHIIDNKKNGFPFFTISGWIGMMFSTYYFIINILSLTSMLLITGVFIVVSSTTLLTWRKIKIKRIDRSSEVVMNSELSNYFKIRSYTISKMQNEKVIILKSTIV